MNEILKSITGWYLDAIPGILSRLLVSVIIVVIIFILRYVVIKILWRRDNYNHMRIRWKRKRGWGEL